uniref:Uncharacterized protein n=1 Tax=Anguilla anguilla TaxID=7936 RepID=A0A0E9UJ68_ANGAN
MSDPSRPEVP